MHVTNTTFDLAWHFGVCFSHGMLSALGFLLSKMVDCLQVPSCLVFFLAELASVKVDSSDVTNTTLDLTWHFGVCFSAHGMLSALGFLLSKMVDCLQVSSCLVFFLTELTSVKVDSSDALSHQVFRDDARKRNQIMASPLSVALCSDIWFIETACLLQGEPGGATCISGWISSA